MEITGIKMGVEYFDMDREEWRSHTWMMFDGDYITVVPLNLTAAMYDRGGLNWIYGYNLWGRNGVWGTPNPNTNLPREVHGIQITAVGGYNIDTHVANDLPRLRFETTNGDTIIDQSVILDNANDRGKKWGEYFTWQNTIGGSPDEWFQENDTLHMQWFNDNGCIKRPGVDCLIKDVSDDYSYPLDCTWKLSMNSGLPRTWPFGGFLGNLEEDFIHPIYRINALLMDTDTSQTDDLFNIRDTAGSHYTHGGDFIWWGILDSARPKTWKDGVFGNIMTLRLTKPNYAGEVNHPWVPGHRWPNIPGWWQPTNPADISWDDTILWSCLPSRLWSDGRGRYSGSWALFGILLNHVHTMDKIERPNCVLAQNVMLPVVGVMEPFDNRVRDGLDIMCWGTIQGIQISVQATGSTLTGYDEFNIPVAFTNKHSNTFRGSGGILASTYKFTTRPDGKPIAGEPVSRKDYSDLNIITCMIFPGMCNPWPSIDILGFTDQRTMGGKRTFSNPFNWTQWSDGFNYPPVGSGASGIELINTVMMD